MSKPNELSVKVNQELARTLKDPIANGMQIAGHKLEFNVTPHDEGGGPYNVYTIALDDKIMGNVYVPDELNSVYEVYFDMIGLPLCLDLEALTRLNNFVNLSVLLGQRIGRLDGLEPDPRQIVLVTKDQLIEAGLISE